jgi:predicted membrane protein
LALGVAPLAALAGVVGLVFEIVFYISKDNDSGDIEHLLEIILIQMLLLAIIVSLLIVGFRPQDWELEKGAHYECKYISLGHSP